MRKLGGGGQGSVVSSTSFFKGVYEVGGYKDKYRMDDGKFPDFLRVWGNPGSALES